MNRKIIALLGLMVAVASACAESRPAETPALTSGTAGPTCVQNASVCIKDADCCSEWCASGTCARRQP